MPTTKPSVIANAYMFDKGSTTLLNKDAPLELRKRGAKVYSIAFANAATEHISHLPDFIPSYIIDINKFLKLVENGDEPAELNQEVLEITNYTLKQLNAAAQYESFISRTKSPGAPHTRPPNLEEPAIKRSVTKHLQFPQLMERFLALAESSWHSVGVRKKAILTFNEVSNSAVTTFGQTICRTDYDARFEQIASSTDDYGLIGVAMEYGYSWRDAGPD